MGSTQLLKTGPSRAGDCVVLFAPLVTSHVWFLFELGGCYLCITAPFVLVVTSVGGGSQGWGSFLIDDLSRIDRHVRARIMDIVLRFAIG